MERAGGTQAAAEAVRGARPHGSADRAGAQAPVVDPVQLTESTYIYRHDARARLRHQTRRPPGEPADLPADGSSAAAAGTSAAQCVRAALSRHDRGCDRRSEEHTSELQS